MCGMAGFFTKEEALRDAVAKEDIKCWDVVDETGRTSLNGFSFDIGHNRGELPCEPQLRKDSSGNPFYMITVCLCSDNGRSAYISSPSAERATEMVMARQRDDKRNRSNSRPFPHYYICQFVIPKGSRYYLDRGNRFYYSSNLRRVS